MPSIFLATLGDWSTLACVRSQDYAASQHIVAIQTALGRESRVARIIEFDTVRIVALRGTPESHLAVSGAERPPRVGDLGTVVHLVPTFDADDPATRYMVESNEGSPSLVWLAEFSRDELEFVARPEA